MRTKIITGLVILFTSSFVIACLSKKDSDQTVMNDLHSGDEAVTAVTVALSKKKVFTQLIQSTGRTRSAQESKVQIKISGILSSILVKNGQYVKKKELLATIENQKFKLDADMAQISLREKSIAFEDQAMGFQKELQDQRAKTIFENIRFTSGLAAAEVMAAKAKLDYEATFLRSPLDGVISDLQFSSENPVESGGLFCIVHDPKSIIVSTEILESEAFQLQIGFVGVVKPFFGEKSYKARILTINPRVDEKTGMVKIELDIIKSDNLIPGMNLEVILEIPMQKNIIVPSAAVVVRSGRQVVFTEEKGVAQWNYVTIGKENGKEVEILSGLEENKKVILTNNLQLVQDSHVRILNELPH